jgi:ABC-type branched-subunit amino acid transport system ATPase component
VVLDGINLHVPEGTIFALAGPQRHRETTTVNVLTTLLAPDAGKVVVVVALRTPNLARARPNDHLAALRMMADRRDELGSARTAVVSRPRRLLLELVPGGAKQFLSATRARAPLAHVRPRDIVGKTRRQLASEMTASIGSATA